MYKATKRIHRKVNNILDKRLVGFRKKQINNTDFTIICNNCWGGYIYRRYGLPYLSPTVGLYFFADDFIKLCSDLKEYMKKPLEFIPYTQSKYKTTIEERRQTDVPIARLGDIEIIFLHYKTREEAEEKWNRRAARINYDNLIFKFSKMNYCTNEHVVQFDAFDFEKKLCFVPMHFDKHVKCGINFKSAAGAEISDDTSEYSRYLNLTKMINSKKVCGKKMEGSWTQQ